MVDLAEAEAKKIIEALDGTELYDVVTASMGYIEENEYFAVPFDLVAKMSKDKYFDTADNFQKNTLTFEERLNVAALNMPAFTESAELCSYMRATLFSRGLMSVIDHRQVKINEVKIVEVTDDANIADPIPENKKLEKYLTVRVARTVYDANKKKMVAWIVANKSRLNGINQLLGALPTMVCHIFVQLGHHFIDVAEYNALADRLLRACVMLDTNQFMRPRNMLLFRTMIHPFGVKHLLHYYDKAASFGKIPAAMIIRRNAAPAGAALVTSSVAVIKQMEDHKWWFDFRAKFDGEVKVVRAVSEHIATGTNRLSYHESAKFMGVAPLTDEQATSFKFARETAERLAPYLQAYIEVYCKNSDLYQIKALNKFAKSRIARYNVIKGAFKADKKRLAEYKTVGDALREAEDII